VTKRATAEILVVDDDREVRESMVDLLELEGYSVRTAGTGREALDSCAADGCPDLILLDLEMPVMDGWQFSREVRGLKHLRRVPVMITSGSTAEPPEAAAVMTKPLDERALLVNVRELLSHA
jgi:CheY-like chemotaxis protein